MTPKIGNDSGFNNYEEDGLFTLYLSSGHEIQLVVRTLRNNQILGRELDMSQLKYTALSESYIEENDKIYVRLSNVVAKRYHGNLSDFLDR